MTDRGATAHPPPYPLATGVAGDAGGVDPVSGPDRATGGAQAAAIAGQPTRATGPPAAGTGPAGTGSAGTGPDPGGRAHPDGRALATDAAVCLAFVALAWWILHALWADPHGRALALNPTDQVLDEWFLALGPAWWHGHVSLVTHLLNAPDGTNLMANTSLLAYGIVLAPVTALLGVPVTFLVTLTAGLCATAAGWYLLFARTLGLNRLAAAAGALVCGFSPGIVSQSNAHPHMTAQWLVPAMVYCLIRLARLARGQPDPDPGPVRRLAGRAAGWVPGTAARGPGRTGRPADRRLRGALEWGAALGLLMVVQVLLGEEVLFLAGLALGLFGAGYAVLRPSEARRLLPLFGLGLVTAAWVAGILLLYPLWVQFAGGQHVPNSPFRADYFYADLATFPAFSPLSLGGSPTSGELSTGAAEYSSYLGWPLILVTIGLVTWQRRRPVVLAAGSAAIVMAWLSLGPAVLRSGRPTGIPALYPLIAGLPLVGSALALRFALVVPPLIGLIIAISVDAAWRSRTALAPGTILLGVGLALVPLIPLPLPAAPRPAVPALFTGGYWRECVQPGGVLVPAPPPTPTEPDTMRWAAATGDAFGLPEGFFIGPYAAGGKASMGTYKQPTSDLLAQVAESGRLPPIGADARARARADLKFWHASCVALAPGPHSDAVKRAVDELIGPGELIVGSWVWRIRS